MLATVICAALTCAASLLLGQMVLGLCGARSFTWLSPAVGFCALMVITVPALHLPGRAATTAAVASVLVIAGAAVVLRDPAQRPPLTGILAAIPASLLALVPFAANGHSGTLGASFNNDMASHLAWAEAYGSEQIARVNGLDPTYPLGPHSLVGALAQGLGVSVDHAFAGTTIAAVLLLGWTGLAGLRRTSWLGQAVCVTLVGLPFIVAGYYGQGSYKEVLEAVLVLAVAIRLSEQARTAGVGRWIPLGLLMFGTLSVYSFLGLGWPLVLGAGWVAGLAITRLARGAPLRTAWPAVRAELGPLALAVGVTALVLLPQLPRLARFVSSTAGTNGTGIEKSSLGNLAGRVPVWEALGVWDSADYRVAGSSQLTTGIWIAFVIGLALLGVAWSIRRGDWMVPLAAVASLLIWVFADRTQSPYVAAKALVMLAPFVALLAVRPLVEREGRPPMPGWWSAGAPVLAVLLAVLMVGSSWDALRFSKVGPRAHLQELRSLRPLLGEGRTLFLGNDDFIRWELAGVPTTAPIVGFSQVPIRVQKHWQYGQAHDFDSVDTEQLNTFTWVISTQDIAGSDPPPQLRLVRQTASFRLYRRVATVPPHNILDEGQDPGAVLRCDTRAGRALSRRDGVAVVRTPSTAVAVPPLPPGGRMQASLRLGRGRWVLETIYGGPMALQISAPGLRRTMAPNLDRPGPRYVAGVVDMPAAGRLTVRFRAEKTWLAPASAIVYPGALIATRRHPVRTLPLRRACGRLVDWYRTRG